MPAHRPIRILALVTDAFGGRGGIAQANRDLLSAMALDPRVREIVVISRRIADPVESVPEKIDVRVGAAQGKMAFFFEIFRALLDDRDFDLVFCGHIHLVPAAWMARSLTRGAPMALMIHGVDSWQPTRRIAVDSLLGRVDAVVAVSDYTRRRFLAWTGFTGPTYVLPNCVHLGRWRTGAKSPDLVERYGLAGRRVMMTLGRIDSRERYKGFDEVIALLPALATEIPEIAYVIAGDGDDVPRLAREAAAMEVDDRVIFTGWVPEDRKGDILRLADLFVLPSRGEGFGIVLLEALACGVPVVASRLDGTREAVLDGRLGMLVDPTNVRELREVILGALADGPPPIDQALLARFDFPNYATQVATILREMVD